MPSLSKAGFSLLTEDSNVLGAQKSPRFKVAPRAESLGGMQEESRAEVSYETGQVSGSKLAPSKTEGHIKAGSSPASWR